MQPETRYAKNDNVHLAYQVFGDGPIDLVWVPGFISHLEQAWSVPGYARLMDRLGSFARVIVLDRRGVGLSDRADVQALDEQVDDVLAVMDAAGAERPALLGYSEGGTLCALLAATHPDRVRTLILLGAYARFLRAPDYPSGIPLEATVRFSAQLEADWGTGRSVRLFAPSVEADADLVRAWASFERGAASPGTVLALFTQFREIDVRDVLPAIRVPTLVLHRTGDIAIRITAGRYLADHIPGARLVELDGIDHLPFQGDQEPLIAEIQEFLTGTRSAPEPDRILASVMFTDIAGSTERASELGDAAWRALLDKHDAVLRATITRYRGREIKALGDGFLVLFDGPSRAARCALEAVEAARGLGLEIRSGVHTGECELMGEDVGGIAVHIASRVASLAGAGEVLASPTVKDLSVGSGLGFADRGTHEMKGVPEPWQLFAVEGGTR